MDKREGYAGVGIPVCLLIDRQECPVMVHSQPVGGTYRTRSTRPYGSVVELPGPVGMKLDTSKLMAYAD